MDKIMRHFKNTRPRPEDDFIEAAEDSVFRLEAKIKEENEEEMEAFMLEEKNIAEVIKSREDLSACRVDEISYRIMKGTGVKFMKLLIRASIQSGRVMRSWKESKTILLYKN
jgi:hypothetical protein